MKMGDGIAVPCHGKKIAGETQNIARGGLFQQIDHVARRESGIGHRASGHPDTERVFAPSRVDDKSDGVGREVGLIDYESIR